MEPRRVGRTLGIGVRVASNMIRDRVERAAAHPRPVTSSIPVPPDRHVGNQVASVKRGVKAFGQALWTPFGHAGGVLWLEITGLFFALFTLFFVQSAYRVRGAWRAGPEHAHLMLYVIVAMGFAWFSVSSFLRAYRKSKRGPGGSRRK
jgi:hypothetical protein